MHVKVISKRSFKIKQSKELVRLLQRLRKSAEKQKGFISRATFSSVSNPGEYIVISDWKSEEHWRKWMAKKKVVEIQGEIDSLIGEKTVFTVYRPETF